MQTNSPDCCFQANTDLIEERPMIVLVVDDIPLNRDIAVALLAKENCKCDVAVDGVEAVAAFKQKPYPYKQNIHCVLIVFLFFFCSFSLMFKVMT